MQRERGMGRGGWEPKFQGSIAMINPPHHSQVLLLACACDRVALGLGDGSDEPQLFTALPGAGATVERGARRAPRLLLVDPV